MIKLPKPDVQINFASSLMQIRDLYLQDALSKTVEKADIAIIDRQLNEMVPTPQLSALAAKGMRGELLFAVPHLLELNPYLLGYYRLLLGFSQKVFYVTETGLSQFKKMEEKGVLPADKKNSVVSLCKALIKSAGDLLFAMNRDVVSKHFLHELTLLTLGAQLRGGRNNQRGKKATDNVFQVIKGIVKHAIIKERKKVLEIKNAPGRKVLIQFASDPDIIIKEEMEKDDYKKIIAIEVKGGQDISNIHNRIGEAEKSHQKARKDGFVECWTVINVDKIDKAILKQESPSTNHFYRISALNDTASNEYKDFCNKILSLTSLARG